jgi:16S rRNA (adenine1518-N6/adenine1519-N6)-dimethyltransferase
MNKIKPLKRFGQNYLQDQNIINKIVDEINPQPDDVLIEIGPGQGSLTEKILNRNVKLTAIEIDKRVIEDLQIRLPKLNLVQNDFMDYVLSNHCKNPDQKLRIFGNIPYNITSPILFKLFENNTIVNDAVFMVQEEVAKRMAAKIGSKDYGILSVLLSYFGKVKIAFKVSPNVFYPKPKVYSAVIHIYFNPERVDGSFNSTFKSIVKSSFGNRRKTLKNSLSNSIFGSVDFSGCGLDISLRAEQLNLDDFIKLTEFACKKSNQIFNT